MSSNNDITEYRSRREVNEYTQTDNFTRTNTRDHIDAETVRELSKMQEAALKSSREKDSRRYGFLGGIALIALIMFFAYPLVKQATSNTVVDRNGGVVEKVEQIRLTASSEELEGQDYKQVYRKFSDAGFTNIELVPLEDLVTGILTKEGTVKEVTINGNATFAKGRKVDEDAKIAIAYHSFKQKK